MEKMMSDLGALYASQAAPQASDINNLANYAPTIPGITYHTYALSFASVGNIPTVVPTTIQTGSFSGLTAQIVPVTLTVDAQGSQGADVSMIRTVQVALIPVFQFGIFANNDLSFFPGANFDFNGRVHTNKNLFLATQASTWTLSFHSKITAVGEVVRLAL